MQSFEVQSGFTGARQAVYLVHAHDATRIIHIQRFVGRTYTLGNFFDIWQEPIRAPSGICSP